MYGGNIEPAPRVDFSPASPWFGSGWTRAAEPAQPYFEPRIPVPPQHEQGEDVRVHKSARKSKRPGKETLTDKMERLGEKLKSLRAYAEHEVQCEMVRLQVMKLVNTWIESADWSELQGKEVEAAELRAKQAPANAKPAEDAAKGLGEHVDWDDVRIQRYTEKVSMQSNSIVSFDRIAHRPRCRRLRTQSTSSPRSSSKVFARRRGSA